MDTMVTLNKAKRVQSMRKRKAARSAFLQELVMNSLMIVGCTLLLYSPTKQFLFLHLPNMLSCLSSPKYVFALVNVIVVFLVGESRLNGYKGSWTSSPTSDVYEEYVGRARAQRKLVTSSLISIQEKSVELVCEVERQVVTVNEVVSLYDDAAVASQTERGIVVVDDEITSFENEVVESESDSESVIIDEITTSVENEVVEQEERSVITENANNDDDEKSKEQVEDKIEEVEEIEEKGGGGAGDELNRRIEDFIARVNRQRQLEIQSLVTCKA